METKDTEKKLNLEDFAETNVKEEKQEDLFSINPETDTKSTETAVATDEKAKQDVHEETSKEKFIRMFQSIEHLSAATKESILNYLEQTDFFVAPASTKFHNNCPEGLVKHSIHVAEVLLDLTEKHGLTWERKDSPLVIGLLHDICKIFTYTQTEKTVFVGTDPKTKKNMYEKKLLYTFDDQLPQLGVHGDKSVAYLLRLAKNEDFTIQELSCIRYHMGATQEGDAATYNRITRVEPLVVWTNIADTIASMTEPILD